VEVLDPQPAIASAKTISGRRRARFMKGKVQLSPGFVDDL